MLPSRRKQLIEYAAETRASATLNFVRALYYHFTDDTVEERIYIDGAVANAINWQSYLQGLFKDLQTEVRSQPWPRSSVEEQIPSKDKVAGSNPAGAAEEYWMKQSYKMGWEAGYDVKHLYQNPYPKDSVEYKEYSQGWDRGRGYAWDSWGD